MPPPALATLEERMLQVVAAGRLRRLEYGAGIDFVSNDYLGFAHSARLHELFLTKVGSPLGAAASRLLRGHTPQHAQLEERLAHFLGQGAALLFSNGYTANVGLLSAVLRPQDRVISDAQNHASIIDGIRLSRVGVRHVVAHLDLVALETALALPHRGGDTYVVVESLYSMDGDQAPLAAIADLCERYEANLIVDDAHGVGLYGERRSGLVEAAGLKTRAFATVSTFGKALGVFGACVSGSALLKQFLINHARSFIFSTAQPPLLLHAIDAALDLLDESPQLASQCLQRSDLLRRGLQESGFSTLRSRGPIVPLIVGDNEAAMAAAAQVSRQGFDVRAVRPPTVAQNTARLRICVHADHPEESILGLLEAITASPALQACRGRGFEG